MISIKQIDHDFADLPVLSDISFDIRENEILSVMGPSGCGKSTLLRIIAGLIKPKSGSISGGCDKVSFVFQDDRLLPWKSTRQNISLVGEREDAEKIDALIRDVGLQGFEDYRPAQLSGGMKKRCGVARAFYYESKLLLLDEPFSGLDYSLRQEMLDMLLRVWEKRKQSIVFITHEADEAIRIADRILLLSGRPSRIVEELQLPDRELRDERFRREIRAKLRSLISLSK